MNKQDEIKYIKDWIVDLCSELERARAHMSDTEDDLSTINKRIDKLEGKSNPSVRVCYSNDVKPV